VPAGVGHKLQGAYSTEAGFATHRIVQFKQQQGRTLIKVDSYIVGTPAFPIAGGGYGFLRKLTEKWFREFAMYCDKHAESQSETEHCEA
jgi:hypothetical protein